ncbi:sugar ABC transporter substrate-binding protein [Oceanispirochaeta sp.]|uniref:ABC transporter substrate-binding protein n=1 Tax=Oceanispirochaeta sp. TaxID=2035350 RepID=UPI0026394DE2|nr:sugar ABC transporter substrate-binding protein [Oceanispirochaeta sp.]MDA3957092.1 sugar ABC transporter substrate-binding protein [Oceanispirochaeta sp.]
MKKRVLAVLLLMSVVLINGLFAAGKQDAGGSTDGKVNVIYSFWGTPDEGKAVQSVADKFNGEQDRIEVEVMSINHDSYVTKLNTMAVAKQLPDCGIMSEAGVLQFAESGLLADVSGMYGPNDSKPLDSLTFKYDNKPIAYSAANEILLMYYNKDMFDKAGVAYPPSAAEKAWTWDEFVETAKLLTFDSKGNNAKSANFDANSIVQYGIMVENLTWQLETWCLSNGGGFFNSDGSDIAISKPASIEAIQKIADLYLVDKVAPLSVGLTDDGVQRSLIAGTCAMTTNGQWNIGTCLASARDEGLNYGVAVLPYMKEKVTICTGGPNVVFSQSKHQAEAMEWVKWYAKEENSWNLIELGIWMPVLEEWYTDEAKTHKWVDNPNFPPYDEYKSAVVDYALNYSRSAAWYYVNNTVDFNTLLGSLLGDVWVGNKTAKEVISEKADALRSAYQYGG